MENYTPQHFATVPARLETEHRPRRILVAEDDPDMRALVAAVLRQSGYRVVEASDGTEILDRIESTIWSARPDQFGAIVSDINMPGLSGLDVLAALRCTYWDTPVVLMTAFGDDDARDEANGLGAVAVLDKPLKMEELKIAVQRAVSGR
jgi:two-component system response regulator PilR (NtrC family)